MSKKNLSKWLPETVPEILKNFLRTLKDDDFIINLSTINDGQATTAIDNHMIDDTNQLLDELYLIVVRNANLSAEDKENVEGTINNVRKLIMKIYISLNEQMSTLHDSIMTLKNQVNSLEQKQMEMKRVNIISEVFTPLKKAIFKVMSNMNVPDYYYNVNILKALNSLNKNDIESYNFYINVHEMTNQLDETTFYSLKQLIYSLSVNENINYGTLLNLLIEKERRNFEEHALITDFIKDSFKTNDARFTTLLRQQSLLAEFQLSEIEILDNTYVKYFGHLHRQH